MLWKLILLGLPSLYLLWTAYTFFQNYMIARATGLPIVFLPFCPGNLFWLFTRAYLAPILRMLPFGLGSVAIYSDFGWSFTDKARLHDQVGGVLVFVSPGHVEVVVAEAGAVESVVRRPKDFPKPLEIYKALVIFGENLDTVEGEDWQRHKKITTPPFNEKNSALVWKEALRQSSDMLHWWTENGDRGVSCTARDAMVLALHVITAAGFGKYYDFLKEKGRDTILPGAHMSYPDALMNILQHLVSVLILPKGLIKFAAVLPQRIRKVLYAIHDFRVYMLDILESERRGISNKEVGSVNLVSVLVRAADAAKQTERKDGRRQGLDDSEILGNMFIFCLAGHETTSNALSYSILLLSIKPEWQDWLSEEINEVLGDLGDVETWEYEKLFPRLNRCLATLFETLRLYSAVLFIPKKVTEFQSQILSVEGKDHLLPANTRVSCNVGSIHTRPRYWGPDANEWRPSRWITTDANKAVELRGIGCETTVKPERGTFIPWSEGPRICPGKKFAQVEFVAVMCRLLRNHRVTPVAHPGENPEQVKARVFGVMEDSGVGVTLRMQHPERVTVSWSKVA